MTANNQQQTIDPVQATRDWLNNMVVGLNLCPFAAPVVNSEALKIIHSTAVNTDQVLAEVLVQLDQLQQSDEEEIATSLLICSEALADFDEYWSTVELAEDLLHEVGLAGIIQIASFHPDYCFEGVEADDVSNYSNRSPYPTFHFIREAQLSRALQHYPEPEKIPDNNIQRLRKLGKAEVLKRMGIK